MSYLVLVRHGTSEWNAKGLWTGWTDISLVEKGHEEARRTAEQLKDIRFDFAYTSALIRAQQTLSDVLDVIQQNPPIIKDKALNEKNYGIYTGKNKWDVQKEAGEEVFQKVRRSWDYVIPEGESLKMVYERTVDYYKSEIEPKLKEGKNVLIASHSNTLRALVKYLEDLSDTQVETLEVGLGEAYVYDIDSEGKVVSKEIRGENPDKGKV